jgi:transcriptional regulator with XRE-family HTH domain
VSGSTAFGSLVKTQRESLGISQEALGVMVGVQRPQISKIESGERLPSFEVGARLAKILNIDLRSVDALDLRPVQEPISSEERNREADADVPPLVNEDSPQW